jgi:hypothetical protein
MSTVMCPERDVSGDEGGNNGSEDMADLALGTNFRGSCALTFTEGTSNSTPVSVSGQNESA